MRTAMTAMVLVALAASVHGQTGDKDKAIRRFGIDLDAKKYPQNTAKDALGSVLKAVGEKQFDYLLAHLVDPVFVDERVAVNAKRQPGGLSNEQKQSLGFDELVKTIADNFQNDPTKLKELQRFEKEGEWMDSGKDAVATLKGLAARKVFMKLVAPERWVLLDREK